MAGKRLILWTGILSVVLVTSTLSSAPPQRAAAEQTATPKPRARLPSQYGKLGVSVEQRERIYAIQADYDSRIDDLQSQIEDLRTKRNSELEGVLTSDQREQLEQIRHVQLAKRRSATEEANK